MSGRIPQAFIDDLLARTDIIDIIDSYIPLRKAGKNYQALCPFHDEKTPSFTVSHEKQFYHCFGCGANGSAIGFLMDFNHMEFVEAVEELAGKAGLDVPREGGTSSVKDEGLTELYELMELIIRHYRDQLRGHPDAQRAIDYLKGRGISGELAARFELGYAPANWDSLIKHFGQSDTALKRLARLGMVIQRDDSNGYYDRFRERIMFPIRDHRGRAIGFGGRILGDGNPKYLNSPETPVFHKGREVYGLYQAKHGVKQVQRLFVVEGYMDVLALVQHDIPNAVATLGTAVTTDHLHRLFRYSSQLVFCFDGDEAGKKAAWRALEISLPLLRDGRQAFFMFMPEGLDPDDFVRQNGQQAFEDPRNFVPLSDYLLNTLKSGNDLGTREGRSRLVDEAIPLVSRLPQGGLRQILLQDISEIAITGVEHIEPLFQKDKNPVKYQSIKKSSHNQGRTPVTVMIELLLYRPQLAILIEDPGELDDIPVPGIPFLKELLELVHSRPNLNCASIIENWRGSRYEARLREIAANSDDRIAALTDPESEMLDAMETLKKQRDKQIRKKLSNIRRMSDLSDEDRERLRYPGKGREAPPDK
ncbi:MAG: DNA primase [Gammaproteobacteria bacterium]